MAHPQPSAAPNQVDRETWVVSGGRPEGPGAPLSAPIIAASNFEAGGRHYYSRSDGTAAVDAFEELLGGLEGGLALAFGSGMAAASAVFDQLATGSEIALPTDCYHGVVQLASDGAERGRWNVRHLDLADTEGWRRAVPECDLVWLESPSNPLLEVADLREICSMDRGDGCVIAVDNTFATPLNQRPLEMGADIVMHSATKFISGHSDALAGALVVGDEGLHRRLARSRTLLGASPGALEMFLATRGARTLALRLQRGQATALALARRLLDQDWVDRVRYPGLESDPHHDVAAQVLDGFGAMVSFELRGSAEQADEFVEALRLIRAVTSLGGVETSIERRAKLDGQQHIPATLLRMSVGCEHEDDLWADLEGAAAVLG